jgi:hypothetical protein
VHEKQDLSAEGPFSRHHQGGKLAASKREVSRVIEMGVNQALDDGENKRGRDAEH